MKYRKLLGIASALFLLISLSLACGGFYKSEEDNLAVKDQLIATGYDYSENSQTLVVSPSFSGKAEEFGYVMPTPSRPQIDVRNESFFRGLDQLTNKQEDDLNIGLPKFGAAPRSGVEVVEKGSAGQYTYTVLRANSSESLLEWLKDNEYQVQEVTRENINYYVNKGDYYFSAFKFDIQDEQCLTREQFTEKRELIQEGVIEDRIRDRLNYMKDENSSECYVYSSVQPIEFVFDTTEPIVPARIMKGQQNHKASKYTDIQLYSSSDLPLVLPGAKVTFSDIVKDDSNLTAGKNSFLVKQEFSLDTRKVDEDIQLELVEPFYVGEQEVVLEEGKNYVLDNSTAEKISYTRAEKPMKNSQLKFRRHFRQIKPIFNPLEFLALFAFIFIGLPFLFALTLILSPFILILAPFLIVSLFIHFWWTLRTWEETNTIKGSLLTTLPGFFLLVFSSGRTMIDSALISAIIALSIALLTICLKKVKLFRNLQSWEFLYSGQMRTVFIFAILSLTAGLVSTIKSIFFLMLPLFQASSLLYCWHKGMKEKVERDSRVRYKVLLAIYASVALLTSFLIF